MKIGKSTGTGNTRRVSKTGTAGMGRILWHTAVYRVPVPRCRGYARVKHTEADFLFMIFITTLSSVFDINATFKRSLNLR